MTRNSNSSSSAQLKKPLISSDGSQDVMVVVQCEPTPQLRTLSPVSAADKESIQDFADSITQRHAVKYADAENYSPLQGDEEPAPVDMQTIKQWRNQTPLMWVWLLSSLVVLMFVPLFVAPGALLLASLTGSALGVISVIMHAMGDRLAETGTFAVSDQIDLAAACATAAGCIDLLAMALAVAWVWAATNMPGTGFSTPDIMPLLMFACNCWQHGVASVAVMQTVGSLSQE